VVRVQQNLLPWGQRVLGSPWPCLLLIFRQNVMVILFARAFWLLWLSQRLQRQHFVSTCQATFQGSLTFNPATPAQEWAKKQCSWRWGYTKWCVLIRLMRPIMIALKEGYSWGNLIPGYFEEFNVKSR
jgi:hypothetical protein